MFRSLDCEAYRPLSSRRRSPAPHYRPDGNVSATSPVSSPCAERTLRPTSSSKEATSTRVGGVTALDGAGHTIPLPAYGHRWYRVGAIDNTLNRTPF